jgi:hypothetical protein
MPMLLIDPVLKGLIVLTDVLASALLGLYGFGVGVKARTRYSFPRVGLHCGRWAAGDRRNHAT